MRDWELVLYKYANFGLVQSECPDSSGPYRPAPAGALQVRVRYRRLTPTFAFTSLYQNGALSLYFTIIAHTIRQPILVCISV